MVLVGIEVARWLTVRIHNGDRKSPREEEKWRQIFFIRFRAGISSHNYTR